MGHEVTFDIDKFMDKSGQVDLSGIDWDDVPNHPLTPETIRVVRYFASIESATFFYMRSVMSLESSRVEAELMPFLSAWNYEEEFHGRAFVKFLRAYGEEVDDNHRADMFASRTFGERFDETLTLGLGMLFPRSWPSVHMMWGAVQELTTYYAYESLASRAGHPILAELCRRIMKQERKHYAFYYQQVRRRLAATDMAKAVTIFALKIGWTPVGDGMQPKEEVHHALRYLFDGVDGEYGRLIDEKMAELPGLGWFHMMQDYLAEHEIRRAPESWFSAPVAAATTGQKPVRAGAAL